MSVRRPKRSCKKSKALERKSNSVNLTCKKPRRPLLASYCILRGV
jgi:hypothetical protein